MTHREVRSKYWDEEYLRYWKERVKEANEVKSGGSSIVEGDSLTTTDENLFADIEIFDIGKGSTVLEMGCGLGRSIPYIYSKTHDIHAIDISSAMIDEAKRACASLQGVEFAVSEAEHTPFSEDYFDHILCYAVFDALFQLKALLEINRILKPGGTVLITGKGDDYYDDDREAYVAEVNARAKGHPNYFTDIAELTYKLDKLGFSLLISRYFARRGDMRDELYSDEPGDHFYEYTLILKKTARAGDVTNLKISDEYSKTFRRINKGE